MKLESLGTPSLILDAGRVRSNAARMSSKVRSLGARLRPHIKTHKCIEVARIQTEGGFRGVTVSTLAEGRAFAAHGFGDITYAVPIEPGKFAAAIELAKTCETLSLVTDDPDIPSLLNEAARAAGLTIPVYMKVDCGYHRCGVEPSSHEAFGIPRKIHDAPNLSFAGILTHAGHSYHFNSAEDIRKIARTERELMRDFAESLRAHGFEVPIVSIGSTPTISQVDHLGGVDEVRPGNYIFFDAFQAAIESCAIDDCALTVLASVVHRSFAHKKLVIDAGAIALSKDRGACEFNPACGYGIVCDLEGNSLGLAVSSLSQEHGEVAVEDTALLDRLRVGTRVRILANHSCLTAAQYSHYNVVDGGEIADQWEIHRGW